MGTFSVKRYLPEQTVVKAVIKSAHHDASARVVIAQLFGSKVLDHRSVFAVAKFNDTLNRTELIMSELGKNIIASVGLKIDN